MLTTTMKSVEKFRGDIPPSEVAEVLDRLSNNCYSAFGKPGNVKTLKLSEDDDGNKVLVAVVEVED